jgi:hypothetical protein
MKASLYKVTFDTNNGDRTVDSYNVVADDAEQAIANAKKEVSTRVVKTYIVHSVEFLAEIDRQ